MLTNNQPLLYTATSKSSHQKALCLLLSLVVILSSSALIAAHLIRTSSVNPYQGNICQKAQDQTSCFAHVSEIIADGSTHFENNQGKLIEVFLKNSLVRTRNAIEVAKNARHKINDAREQAALADCATLMEMSVDRMQDSVVRLQKLGAESQADVHTWLSSVLTNYITCSDGLAGSASTSVLKPLLDDLTSRAKTSLALFVAAYPPEDSHTNFIQQLVSELPAWVSSGDRSLLQAGVAGSVVEAIAADVVVAKDGSGKYKTVKEAVASAPDKGTKRYVIYVKKGTYKENVEIGKTKTNVMLVGDGMDQTIITGSLNFVDNVTTFNSATVAVNGDGFMAQDIWFQNTAGAAKHQAVALRVSADKSVINRCKIDAYQDTLYTHTNRQFYRDSYITGTVDFIFGNAGVVFQNCKIVARKPMSNQSNMVTAQGRTDPNQNTGTSIQNCNVIASSDLEPVKGSIKSYLGRPWKEYSRTVVMQSYIGDHIDPAGWSVWSGDFALKTLYYGEYLNRGPGAGTSKRVTWAGYHVITSAAEAQKFTVAELIQGGVWLKSTGVTYTEGL